MPAPGGRSYSGKTCCLTRDDIPGSVSGGCSVTDTHPTRTTTRGLSRRAVTRGALWAAPTLVVTSAAPAMAASLRKDPGINGWVRASWGSELVGWWRRYTLTVNSTVSGVQTPDGAPFGLYLYDTDPADVYTDATFTYWINDTQASIQWT